MGTIHRRTTSTMFEEISLVYCMAKLTNTKLVCEHSSRFYLKNHIRSVYYCVAKNVTSFGKILFCTRREQKISGCGNYVNFSVTIFGPRCTTYARRPSFPSNNIDRFSQIFPYFPYE